MAARSAMIELTNPAPSNVIIHAGKSMPFAIRVKATSVPEAAPHLLALEENINKSRILGVD